MLINAELQRKQRQEKNRRVNAAIFVQRVTRGHLSRLRTIKEFSAHVVDSKTPAVISSLPRNDDSRHRLAALSFCLSYHFLLTKLGITLLKLAEIPS